MLSRIGTYLYTRWFGTLMGQDDFGNSYYQLKKNNALPKSKQKRWVLYNGISDASKIPAEWHGWLHKTYENPLKPIPGPFRKSHLPNSTGSVYLDKHINCIENIEPVRLRSYEPWTPNP
jgi:NADH:ubiquinone oxidoreductase subunit